MPEGVEIQITASARGAEEEITRLRSNLRGLQGDASNTSGTDRCRDSLDRMGESGRMTARRLEDLTDHTRQNERQNIRAARAHNTFMHTLGKVTKMMVLRTALRSMMKAMKEGIDNLYEWSKLHDKRFSKAMDKGATAVLYMKNSLATAFAPVIIAIMPLIVKFSHLINTLSNAFAMLFATITGQGHWTKALEAQAQYTTSINDTHKKLKELLADWDELNVIQSETGSDKDDGMPSISSMFEDVELEGGWKKVSDFIASLNIPFSDLLATVLAIKAAFLGIKFVKKFLTGFENVKNWASTLWEKLFGNGKQNLSNLGEGIDLSGLGSNMSQLSNSLDELGKIDWSPLNNLSNLDWLKNFDFNGLKELGGLDLSGLNPFKELMDMFSAGGIAKIALISGGIALFSGFLKSLASLSFGNSKQEVSDLQTKLSEVKEEISTLQSDMNGIFDQISEYAVQKMNGTLEALSSSIGDAMRRISILVNWINLSVKPSLNFGAMGNTRGMLDAEDEIRKLQTSLALVPAWIKRNVLSIIEFDVQETIAQIKADIAGIQANIETNYSGLSGWVKTTILQPIKDEVERFTGTLGGSADMVSVQAAIALLPAWIKRNVLSVIEYDVQQSVAQIKADFAGISANFQTVLNTIPGWVNENVWSVILADLAGFRAVAPTVLDLGGMVDDWKMEFNALPSHIIGTLTGVLLYCALFRGLVNIALNLTGMINSWKTELSALPDWIRDNPMLEILNNVRLFVNGVNGFLAGIERRIDIYVVTHYLDATTVTGELGRQGGSRGSSVGRHNFPLTNLPTIPRRASGGLLNSGQLYVTRENGIPEFVGSFGNQGAVANNEQIVKGIASGVAEANSALESRLARVEDLMERFISKKFYAEVKPSTSLGRVVRQSEEMRLRTEGA